MDRRGPKAPSEPPLSFGGLLQRHRLSAGLSQEDLAERAGMSRRGVSDLERGLRRAPYLATIRRLAEALGLSESDRVRLLEASRGGHPDRGPASTDLPSSADAGEASPRGVLDRGPPRQLTSFIGRDRDVLQLVRQLAGAPVLTLTGPGGVGKTRLALRLIQDVLPVYHDRVWFVELAGVANADLVPQVVAETLGVVERANRRLVESVAEYVGSKHALLVLDNCEHLVMACAAVAEQLLGACPRLQIITTSRVPLHIAGEATWQVEPLVLPNVDDTLVDAAATETVRLFVDRARSSVPWFNLSDRNVREVVTICRALDGLPLAIELAACRLKLLGIEDLAVRLGDRLRLLRGGNRTAPARQQTLQAALDWSYQLLSADERLLFARLSVFAGGWTLDAAERVGSGVSITGEDVLDWLEQLVDCSLVQTQPDENGGMRYALLDIIRDYGQVQLRVAGSAEVQATQRRHAAFFCELAEREDAELIGPTQALSFGHIEREHDNLRAALRWALDGDTLLAVRLGAALARFWFIRGHLSEGRNWLEAIAGLAVDASAEQTAAQAKVLNGAGNLATLRGDFVEARGLLTESLRLRRAVGDRAGAARTLLNLGNIAISERDYVAAEELFDQSLRIQRDLGNIRGVARTLNNLAVLAREQGRIQRMTALADEALDLSRQVGDPEGVALALVSRGIAARLRGEPAEAISLLQQSLRLFAELGHRREIAENIELLAGLECVLGQAERAARLFAAAEAILAAVGLMPLAGDRFQYAENLAALRANLAPEVLAARWQEGSAFSLEQAVSYALVA